MKLVRGRADVRFFPSRHNFALFRLAAYLRLRAAKPEHGECILAIDRHQSNFEHTLVPLWYALTLTCFGAAWLFAAWPLPLALLASFPVALFALEVPLVLGGIATSAWNAATGMRVNAVRVTSILMMTLFAAAAAHFARQPTWVRFAGLQVLALIALNALAAAIVLFLRPSIARLEAARSAA